MVKRVLSHPTTLQLVKFGIVGVGNTAMDAAIYAALTRLFPFFAQYPLFAVVIAFAFSVLNSFVWNKHWTFQDKVQFRASQLASFYVANGAAMVLNAGFFWLFLQTIVPMLSFPSADVVGKVMASVAAGIFNFGFQKWLTFGGRKNT